MIYFLTKIIFFIRYDKSTCSSSSHDWFTVRLISRVTRRAAHPLFALYDNFRARICMCLGRRNKVRAGWKQLWIRITWVEHAEGDKKPERDYSIIRNLGPELVCIIRPFQSSTGKKDYTFQSFQDFDLKVSHPTTPSIKMKFVVGPTHLLRSRLEEILRINLIFF